MAAFSTTLRRFSVARAGAIAIAVVAASCRSRPLSVPACVDVEAQAPETQLCTTFTRDRAFDAFVASELGGPQIVGSVAGTGATDVYVALNDGLQGTVARWSGAGWATETLALDAFAVSMLTIDVSGDATGEPWALVTKRGSSKSGIDGPATLVHRRNGKWVVEPNPPSGTPAAVGGTRSGLFVSTTDPATGAGRVWQWLDRGWRARPVALSVAETTARATVTTTGFWGGRCGEALAFGGGLTHESLFGVLFRLVDTGWDAVDVPVSSDILAVSGPSLDELYLLALNRGRDGASHFFHLTNDLTTWTPLLTPVTVDYAAVYSPGESRAVAVGCEWPDKLVPRARDCARLTTIEGDTLSTNPLPNVEGAPSVLWHEPLAGGALHLFTYVPDPNGLPRAQHYVAPATCP
jgi:hypothetical protein